MKHKTLIQFFRVAIFCVATSITLMACSPAQEQQKSENKANIDNAVNTNIQPYLTRDIKDEIFYFVMPDRFHNANTNNDNGDPNRPISFGGLDKSSKWAFHGGDIAGGRSEA